MYETIDPYKICAAVINEPGRAAHYETDTHVHSVAFESQFDHSIGFTNTPNQKGFFFYIHITENSDPFT